jgi:hypothetical protein
MMADKLVPMMKDGQAVSLAVSPADFFSKPLCRTAGGLVPYAEAGYALGDRYEDLSEYDGPKTKRQAESRMRRAEAEKPAERASSRAAAEKPAAKKD